MRLKHKIMSILSILLILTMFTPFGNTGVTNVSAGGYCDWVQFVADVTIPDGVPVDPGQALKKTWRLKNIGTCAWTTSYKLVFVSGEPMGGVTAMNLPKYVEPGQTIDLTIGLAAPTTPGLYRGYWQLQNTSGGLFGYGTTANKPFWVAVRVVSKAAPVYDFVANAPAATWVTEATGKLNFPGFYGDPNGFVIVYDRPILENGIPATAPGILMAPPAEYNEHIYGFFPSYVVRRGDRFQATIGCEYGASDCEVKFVLQYQEENLPGRTFFSISKTYTRSSKFLDFSLNSLEGKRVTFTLLIRPVGSSTGDRALWVNPVIINTTLPAPSIPTVTPIAATAIPTISTLPSYTGCDRATFVSDVTVLDGTVFNPGQTFTKTWRLRNTGKCTWTTDYSLVFSSGDQMGGPSPVKLPSTVAPGQTIDLSLNLTAPNTAGGYRGYWTLMNAQGGLFGIGTLANKPFWLAITVAGTQPATNGYDFVAHVCDAKWTSGVGELPCPSNSASDGTVLVTNSPHLENDTVDSRPSLFTVPQNAYNGYVQGVYPSFTVQQGDRFKSIVSCEYLHKNCFVVYRLDYQIDNGPVKNLWAFGERYDRMYYQADIDLSPLAGQTVKFILRTNANGSPTDDNAIWVAPSIVRSGSTVPPVLTATPVVTSVPVSTQTSTPVGAAPTATLQPSIPTATLTPVPSNVYVNSKYGFTFMLPSGSSLAVFSDNRARVTLPVTSGTNLAGKYLDVMVVDGLNPCHATGFTNPPASSANAIINGITFLAETGTDSALGNVYAWKAYSTLHNNACVSMNFVLYSTNNGAPQYDAAAESSVFESMMATFGFTSP